MKKTWEICKPKLTKVPGSIVIYGTGGDIERDKYIGGFDPYKEDGSGSFKLIKYNGDGK